MVIFTLFQGLRHHCMLQSKEMPSHFRSDYAMQIDFEEEAPAFKVTDTHWAKTWLLHPDAPTVHKPEVIENLHEKIGSKMGFTHITE